MDAKAQDAAQKLPSYADQSYIMLAGNVGEINGDEFILNHSGGQVTVEFEDWEWGTDLADYLQPGERVVVSGQVDDDLFEGREIEANNIYTSRNYTYYYVNDVNPSYTYDSNRYGMNNSQNTAAMNDGTSNMNEIQTSAGTSSAATASFTNLEDGAYVTIKGRVQSTDGDQFMIMANGQTMEVDVSDMSYNPLNGNITTGDRVSVMGEIDEDFLQAKQLDADSVVLLSKVNSRGGTAGDNMQ
jgi:uncharacterized protein YdeI (BOF family)